MSAYLEGYTAMTSTSASTTATSAATSPQVSQEVSAEEARERLADSEPCCLLDVRSGVEFEAEHVPGSTHVPLDQLERRLEEVRAKAGALLLLCRTGARAERARKVLAERGLPGACVVAGGLEAWRAAGGETVRGAPGMSLERQVRIGAGSLGLAGVVLGFAVHPGFFLLSGFVSAGLIFAGLTDWCGMGLLLARMPWNRRIAADGPD